VEEIADAIRDSNIRLEMYHPESAPGQFEMGAAFFINPEPLSPNLLL
jgi:glutamine synthetase